MKLPTTRPPSRRRRDPAEQFRKATELIVAGLRRMGHDDAAIEPIKVALTAGQVREMGLPPILKAKADSSRYKGFVAKHGDDVFELEAVPPDRLQVLLRHAIDAVIDVDAFNAEVEAEKHDAARLAAVRKTVHEMLGSLRDSGLN